MTSTYHLASGREITRTREKLWPHTLLARLLKGVREEGGMRASFHPPYFGCFFVLWP